MRDPVHIFLASSSGSRNVICEVVEWSAPLIEVLDLLEDHGLTAHFERSCPVIPKRNDGSSIPVPLMASQTVSEVHLRLQEALVRIYFSELGSCSSAPDHSSWNTTCSEGFPDTLVHHDCSHT